MHKNDLLPLFIVLMMLALIPGSLALGTWKFCRALSRSKPVRLAGLFPVLLALYGFGLGRSICDLSWNGLLVVSDATPRFSYGPGPVLRDYLVTGWYGWLWLCLGVLALAYWGYVRLKGAQGGPA